VILYFYIYDDEKCFLEDSSGDQIGYSLTDYDSQFINFYNSGMIYSGTTSMASKIFLVYHLGTYKISFRSITVLEIDPTGNI
jgi:hypothetical protein